MEKTNINPFPGHPMPRHERNVTLQNASSMRIVDIQKLIGNRFDGLMDGFNPEGEFADND